MSLYRRGITLADGEDQFLAEIRWSCVKEGQPEEELILALVMLARSLGHEIPSELKEVRNKGRSQYMIIAFDGNGDSNVSYYKAAKG